MAQKIKAWKGWLCLLLAWGGMADGQATYYVSPLIGNDANNGTSITSAWKTCANLNFGSSQAPPSGSTILFDGTNLFNGGLGASYSFNFLQTTGSSGHPCVLSNWGGSGWGVTNTASSRALVMKGLNWVYVYNFNASNNATGILMISCTNCAFIGAGQPSYCINNSNGGFNFGADAMSGDLANGYGCQSNYFSNFVVTNLVTTLISGSSTGGFTCANRDGGSINGYEGDYDSTTDLSGWNIIENSVFAYAGHSSMEIAGTHSMVLGSLMFNPATYAATWLTAACDVPGFTGITGPMYWGGRIVSLGGENSGFITFISNTVAWSGIVADQPPALHLENAGNCCIAWNLIYGAASCGIEINGEGLPCPAGSNYLSHNTLTQNGYDWGNYITGAPVQISYPEYNYALLCSSSSNNCFANNLLYNNNSQSSAAVSLPGGGNAFASQISDWRGNMTNINPAWASTNGSLLALLPNPPVFLNLNLSPGSPAIGAGVFLCQIASATGSGASFAVYSNAAYFWGPQTAGPRTVPGAQIELANGQTATITAISGNTITVNHPINWAQGMGVGFPFINAMPSVGAEDFAAVSLNFNVGPGAAIQINATNGVPLNLNLP